MRCERYVYRRRRAPRVSRPRRTASRPGRPGPPQPPRTPRDAAQVDLTGNWVAQITEDWRWRMITPPKGDYASVPLNALGRQTADGWDRRRRRSGRRAMPRVRRRRNHASADTAEIAWADDNTLRIETDAGEQIRVFHFDAAAPASGEPTGKVIPSRSGPVAPPADPFGGVGRSEARRLDGARGGRRGRPGRATRRGRSGARRSGAALARRALRS